MKKHILLLGLILLLVTALFAGCNNDNTPADTTDAAVDTTVADVTDTPTEPDGDETTEAPTEETTEAPTEEVTKESL